jgi:hypothetical protein
LYIIKGNVFISVAVEGGICKLLNKGPSIAHPWSPDPGEEERLLVGALENQRHTTAPLDMPP